MLIWHFVYFFICRPKLLILLIIVLTAGGVWFAKNYERLGFGQQPIVQAAVSKLPTLRHTPKKSTGRFALDVATTLDEPSQQYYAQQYQFTMNSIEDGKPYLWVAHDTLFGKITPYKMFQTKRGVYCRKYNELLHGPRAAHIRDGIACQKTDGTGWCRLPAKAIPNCEIGFSGDDSILGKVKGLF